MYADFGHKPGLRPELEALVQSCWLAGREWARQGNEKLPQRIELGGVEHQIVRSRTDWAQAFVRGWKEVKTA